MNYVDALAMKLAVDISFRPVMENLNKKVIPVRNDAVCFYDSVKNEKATSNDPKFLIAISILEELIQVLDNIIQICNEIPKLDWFRDETELQYESMRRCLDALHERARELNKQRIMILGKETGE